jgi:hypothetical protein
MPPLRVTLAVTFTLVIIFLGAFVYKFHSDKVAWEKIQTELVRLHSGLEFESIIALRSHLADTDAALKIQNMEWRTYPPGRVERIRNAEQSLRYINLSLDSHTRGNLVGGDILAPSDVRELEKYPEVTTWVPRLCAEGQVRVYADSVGKAFTIVGMSLLDRAEYPTVSNPISQSTGQLPPLNFGKETAACQREEEERRGSAQRKYWSQFHYRVVLGVLESAPGSCVFEAKTDGKYVGRVELVPGRKKDFGINHDLLVFETNCYGHTVPQSVIVTTVNGKAYATKWDARNGIIKLN